MTVIHKTADDWRVRPNLTDYAQTRADFSWAATPRGVRRDARRGMQYRLRSRRPAL